MNKMAEKKMAEKKMAKKKETISLSMTFMIDDVGNTAKDVREKVWEELTGVFTRPLRSHTGFKTETVKAFKEANIEQQKQIAEILKVKIK